MFELGKVVEDEALISYELDGVNTNQRRFITSKESEIFDNVMNKYECQGAESWRDVEWRRPEWRPRQSASASGVPFRPCGLAAMSMFDDAYTLHSCSDASCDESEPVQLDESDVSMSADEDVYWRLQAVSGAIDFPFYRIESRDDGDFVDTWLPAGNFLEHFKVWQRTSAAPRIRNLWAVVRGGLQAGHYRLNISNNDPIWEQYWGVKRKTVVISSSSSLGSAGACGFLGRVATVFACLLAVVALIFITAPKPQHCQPQEIIDVPMPEGKPDLTHYILPPTQHYFTSRRGDKQHIRCWAPSAIAVRGTVLYLHGYSGHVNSAELSAFFDRLCDVGFAVFTFDFRGHGYSPGERCLIRDFDHLLDDIVDFVRLLLGNGPVAAPGFTLGVNMDHLNAIRAQKHFVFGESMGGALALVAAQRLSAQKPAFNSEFGGAIVVAPALSINLPPVIVQILLRSIVAPLVPSWPVPSLVSKNTKLDMAAMFRDEGKAALSEKDDWGEAKGGLGWKKGIKWGTASAFSMFYSKLDQTIKKMDFPILVLHDPEDSICRYEGSLKLMELSPSEDKHLIDVPNGLHCIRSNEPDLMLTKAVGFLRGHL